MKATATAAAAAVEQRDIDAAAPFHQVDEADRAPFGDDAVGRHHDFGSGVARKAIAPGEDVVVPGDDDRGGALGHGGGLADHRNEVAGGIELGEVG